MTNNFQEHIINSFQSLNKDKQLLAKVIEFFPYPIQIYSPDGISVMVNKAMLAEYNAPDPSMVVGKYNLLKDSSIIRMGQMSKITKAFKGETVFFNDVEVPIEDIKEKYGINDLDIETIYQDITLFPILDDNRNVIYVAALLINREVYKSKDKIEKARMFIETHWQEKFNIQAIADHVDLSKAHFAKLFKKHTGLTPYEHYNIYRINMVKEKLMDTNLSISQAFCECNIEYSGHYAKLFKEIIGLTPTEYRKKIE